MTDIVEQLYRFGGPYRPVTKQSPDYSFLYYISIYVKAICCKQISYNVIVIPCIKGDIIPAAGFAYRPHNIQCAIPIKRSHLNALYSRQLSQFSPEGILKPLASNRWL
ncbi:hypothetical protein D3C80_1553400 [compost metagenome]